MKLTQDCSEGRRNCCKIPQHQVRRDIFSAIAGSYAVVSVLLLDLQVFVVLSLKTQDGYAWTSLRAFRKHLRRHHFPANRIVKV
jgi:hypothetical protein